MDPNERVRVPMTGNEEDVIRYYNHFWTKSETWWDADKSLAMHLGYYDKGVRSLTKAALHMNDVAWQLLHLNPEIPGQVLDAGCGVGGTSIYLAQKYPQMSFTGITIVPEHVSIAERLAQKHHVTSNTRFFEQNYCHTIFADHTFDGIIALESVVYAHTYEDLIQELYRVLKPGGHIVIFDAFRTDRPLPSSLKKIYQIWLQGRALVEVEPVSTFTSGMKQKGFHHVTVHDISSHVAPSYVLGSLVDSGVSIYSSIKGAVQVKNHDSSDEFNGFIAASLGVLFVLKGCFKYYIVTAMK